MAKTTNAAPADDNDRCENCGACKHCGSGGRPQYVPMPYPVYPQPYFGPYVSPYRAPSRPQQPTWINPNTIYGTGQTFTTGTNHASWNFTGGGNYQ